MKQKIGHWSLAARQNRNPWAAPRRFILRLVSFSSQLDFQFIFHVPRSVKFESILQTQPVTKDANEPRGLFSARSPQNPIAEKMIDARQ